MNPRKESVNHIEEVEVQGEDAPTIRLSDFHPQLISYEQQSQSHRPFRQMSQAERIRRSHSRGGISAIIAAELDEGTPLDVIEGTAPFTKLQIKDAERKTLRKWGYYPYETRRDKSERLLNIFNSPLSTDIQKKEALGEVSLRFYKSHSDLFVALEVFLRENGYHIADLSPLLGFLEDKIPVGTLNYQSPKAKRQTPNWPIHFMIRADEKRASEALDSEEWVQTYKKNPVVQVSGLTTLRMPTTNDFRRNHDQYMKVGSLMTELGIPKYGNKFNIGDFFAEKTDVPIFTYQTNFIFEKKNKDSLAEFMLRRYRELLKTKF